MGDLSSVLAGVKQDAAAQPAEPTQTGQPQSVQDSISTAPAVPVVPAAKPVQNDTDFQKVMGNLSGTEKAPPQDAEAATVSEDDILKSMRQKQQAAAMANTQGFAGTIHTIREMTEPRLLNAFISGTMQQISDTMNAPSNVNPDEINKSVPITGEENWLEGIAKNVVKSSLYAAGSAADFGQLAMGIAGAPFEGGAQALEQLGKETGTETPGNFANVIRDPAMMMLMHQVAPLDINMVRDVVAKPPLDPEVYRAINNEVITPGDPALKSEALKYANISAARMYADQEALHTPEEVVTPAEKEVPTQPTVHDIARQDNTQLFGEYDPLSVRRDFYTDTFNDLLAKRRSEAEENAPHNDEIAELQEKQQDANARKTKIYQERIDELKAKNEDYVTEQMNPLNFDGDLKLVRSKLSEASIRLGQLEPDVRAALSEARTKLPPEEAATPEGAKPFEPTEGHLGEFKDDEGKPIPETPPEVTDNVANKISKSLQDAGRPKEEADAHAQIAASFYKTMADVYGGKHGTAEDWLAREGATVKEGGAGKTIRGSYKPATDNAKATIRLLKSANETTFIHESAHHFLNVLDKYAAQEDAPQRLKDDYASIRKWLGVKDEADLFGKNEKGRYTHEKQQEQFAKGFENYVREGVAPTRELAGVFAKLRNWFSNIYKAALKLDVPINDEVRGVFDRLLALNPEKTTIAPEENRGTLADVHVKEAARATPETAAGVRDTIRAETDITLKREFSEVYNEVKDVESRIRNGDFTPEASDNTADTGSERGPAGERETSEPANVGEGRDVGSEESTNDRESDNPLGNTSRSLDSVRDKVGNIRPELLSNEEEFRAALTEAAKSLHLDHDVTTDIEVARLAQALGVKGSDVVIAKLQAIADKQGVPLAAWTRAGMEALVRLDGEARRLASKVADGTEADLNNFTEAFERFKVAAQTVSDIKYQQGLALRAHQDISEGAKSSAAELDELFQRVHGATQTQMKDLARLVASKDPNIKGAASKVMRDASKPNFWDHFAEYRRCSILSGWVTHSLWLAGTAVNLGYKALILDTLSGLHNEIGKLMGRTDTGSEVFGGLKGLANAIEHLPNILSATGTAAKEGRTVLRPFEGDHDTFLVTGGIKKIYNVNADVLRKAVDESFNVNDHDDLKSLQERLDKARSQGDDLRADALQETLTKKTAARKDQLTHIIASEMQNKLKTWRDLGHEMHDFASSVLSGIEAVGKNMFSPEFYKNKSLIETKRDGGVLPDVYVKGVDVLPLGTIMRGTSNRIYSTMHTFTREIAANIETVQEARRIAVEEGKTGEAIEARKNELLSNPTPEFMKRVTAIANKQTLMSNESSFAKVMTGLRNKLDKWSGTKAGSILFPVIGVPAESLAQTVVDSSVLGVMSKAKRDALMGRAGLPKDGEATPSQLKQAALEQERAQVKMLAGTALLGLGVYLAKQGMVTPSPPVHYKEEEVRQKAGQQSGSVRLGDWMVNLTHLPVQGAILTAGADIYHISQVYSGKDLSDKMSPAVSSAVNNVFFHENALVGMADLIDAMRGKADPIGYMNRQGDALIPQFIKQTNDMLDPLQRESKGFIASAQSRIPLASESLAPKINAVNGEPLEREPYHTYSANPDPVAQEYLRLRVFPTNPIPRINGVDLSSQQGAEYSAVKGHIQYNGMQMLMEGDGKQDYDEANDNDKRKMIQRIQKHASTCAKAVMFNKYPDLLKDANEKSEADCFQDVGQ